MYDSPQGADLSSIKALGSPMAEPADSRLQLRKYSSLHNAHFPVVSQSCISANDEWTALLCFHWAAVYMYLFRCYFCPKRPWSSGPIQESYCTVVIWCNVFFCFFLGFGENIHWRTLEDGKKEAEARYCSPAGCLSICFADHCSCVLPKSFSFLWSLCWSPGERY